MQAKCIKGTGSRHESIWKGRENDIRFSGKGESAYEIIKYDPMIAREKRRRMFVPGTLACRKTTISINCCNMTLGINV